MKLILVTVFVLMLGNNITAQQGRKIDERHSAEFRYVIFSNDVGRDNAPYRSVGVLLDEAAFSKQTLRKLFYLMSKRFPEPQTLEVWVSTSL